MLSSSFQIHADVDVAVVSAVVSDRLGTDGGSVPARRTFVVETIAATTPCFYLTRLASEKKREKKTMTTIDRALSCVLFVVLLF